MNQAGVPAVSRYGKAIVNKKIPWLVSRLSAMLRNETYLGRYIFRSKKGVTSYDVLALIDRTTWNNAHFQLERNWHRRESKHRLNLLKGIIQCQCGAFMSAVPAYTGKPKHYYRHIYRCNASVKYRPDRQRYDAKQIPADDIEAWVWAGLAEILHNPDEAINQAKQHLQERQSQDTPELRQNLTKALYENQKKRERIIAWYRDSKLSSEEAELHYQVISKEQQAIESELHQLEFRHQLNIAIEDQYKEAANILKQHYDLVDLAKTDISVKFMLIQKFTRRVLITTTGTGRNKDYDITADYVIGGSKYRGRTGDFYDADYGPYYGEVLPVNDCNSSRDV